MLAAPSLAGSVLLVLGGRLALHAVLSPARPTQDRGWRLVIFLGLVSGFATVLTLFWPR